MLHGVQHFGSKGILGDPGQLVGPGKSPLGLRGCSKGGEYTVSTEVKLRFYRWLYIFWQNNQDPSQKKLTLICSTALMYCLIVQYVWWKIRNTS